VFEKLVNGVTITRNSYTMDELFKNDSFRRFAPYFLEQPQTIIKVEELSGISRRTISEILESFQKDGEYDSKYIGWYGGSKGLKIKIKWLSDYMALKFGLSQDESEVLDELFTQSAIQKTIISENFILDMALMKALMLAMVVAVKNQMELDDPKYEERQKYFKKVLEKAYKKAPKGLFDDIEKLVPKEGMPMKLGLANLKDKNLEPWFNDYIKKNRKPLGSILVKMRYSNFPLVISLNEMYDILLIRFGGIPYIKRQSEVGSPEWIQRQMDFRSSLKKKKAAKPKSDKQ
jgi:hypothetical protein